VLSPWIRRALVAGGFGGIGEPTLAQEHAAVHDSYDKADSEGDPESAGIRYKPSSPAGSHDKLDGAPLYPQDTPFFHFDLASAVRAAERRKDVPHDAKLDAKD
jgi:solute carrier family 26 (sodium-independent sulfate anion transporter), member 11